jgi:hypothetical protein
VNQQIFYNGIVNWGCGTQNLKTMTHITIAPEPHYSGEKTLGSLANPGSSYERTKAQSHGIQPPLVKE